MVRITLGSIPFLAVSGLLLVVALWLMCEGNHDEFVVVFAIGAAICVRFSGVFDNVEERQAYHPAVKGKCHCGTDHASQDFLKKSGEEGTLCPRCYAAPPVAHGGICRECAFRDALAAKPHIACSRCGQAAVVDPTAVCISCGLPQAELWPQPDDEGLVAPSTPREEKG